MKRIDEIFGHSEVSEKAIERYLVSRVTSLGGIALKFSSATEIGYPDRIVLLRGGIIAWCELKSKGKKPRRIQEIAHDRLRHVGQRVFVCDSKESVDAMIKELYG